MIFLITAIKSINPTAEVAITNEDIDNIQQMNGTAVISKEDILAKQVELQSEYDALDYARNRAKEYPSIEDQLDDIFHNGVEGWKTSIQVIKTKYPKG